MNSIEEQLTRPGGLANRLKDLRFGANLTGNDLGTRLGWSQSKISKIENGKQVPTLDEVEAWARMCAAREETIQELHGLWSEAQIVHRRWQDQVRHGQVAIQRDYGEMERQAKVIRNAEVAVIPGLLQTPDYARGQALQSVRLHGADAAEVEATVAARMRRQEILYDTSKRFEFVITEAALRLVWCPPAAMLAQLDRLMSVTTGPPHIWFGIIPFGVELPIVAQCGFVMHDDTATIEDYVNEIVYHGEAAAGYHKAMDLLTAEAWTDERARHLIVQAMRDLRSRQDP